MFSIYIRKIIDSSDIKCLKAKLFTDTEKPFTDKPTCLAELAFCHPIVGNSFASSF